MTDMATTGSFPEPHALPRFTRWVRHHPWPITFGILVSLFIAGWFSELRFVSGAVYIVSGYLNYLLIGALSSHHNPKRICPECGTVPLDPQALLTKHRWKLRLGHSLVTFFGMTVGLPITLLHKFLHHRYAGKKVMFAGQEEEKATIITAIVMMITFVTAAIYFAYFVDLPVGTHSFAIGWMILIFLTGVGGSLTIVHNRLRLWCPYCKDWGDDDDVDDPIPDPDPADAHPLDVPTPEPVEV